MLYEYDVISVKRLNNKISKCTTKVAHDITTVIVITKLPPHYFFHR